MITQMKMFLIAIACCAAVSMIDLNASAKPKFGLKAQFVLTPIQESLVTQYLITKTPTGYAFIKNPQGSSEAADIMRDIMQSLLVQEPRIDEVAARNVIYTAIEQVLPPKTLKGGLMQYVKYFVDDYYEGQLAMGR